MSKYDRPRSVGWSDKEIEIIIKCDEENRSILEIFSRLNKDYNDVRAKYVELTGKEPRSERTGSASL